jgi:hypothetical protein
VVAGQPGTRRAQGLLLCASHSLWHRPNLTYCFETPQQKPRPQHGEPPIEARVLDTSRDGRAGGGPPTAAHSSTAAGTWGAKMRKQAF